MIKSYWLKIFLAVFTIISLHCSVILCELITMSKRCSFLLKFTNCRGRDMVRRVRLTRAGAV